MGAVKRRRLIAAAVTAGLAVVAVGCGSSSSSGGSSAPGVTDTSITFGTHQPLTGPAAPGYDEIAPASQAFFNYVNAHGGVYGRKIHLIIKDDAYNPTNTVNVVHQLVLQNKVFGIFEGLGTPTHTKVVSFLNASKVPDMFVASGCPCWDNGGSQPQTFGWQPNYTIEGKILGQYLKQHFASAKIGVLYQDDDFGKGGLQGIEDEVPAGSIVAKEPYQAGHHHAGPAGDRDQGGQGDRDGGLHRPHLHRIAQLTSFTLGFKPQLVVSNVGIDPTTVAQPAQVSVQGQGVRDGTDRGRHHRRLPAVQHRRVQPVDQAVPEGPRPVRRQAPFDGNVEYGMANAYTLVQALKAAGKNLTRADLVNAVSKEGGKWTGPGLVPYRYNGTQHGGFGGAEMGKVQGGKIVLFGGPLTTSPDASSPITPYTTPQAAPPTSGVPSN